MEPAGASLAGVSGRGDTCDSEIDSAPRSGSATASVTGSNSGGSSGGAAAGRMLSSRGRGE